MAVLGNRCKPEYTEWHIFVERHRAPILKDETCLTSALILILVTNSSPPTALPTCSAYLVTRYTTGGDEALDSRQRFGLVEICVGVGLS